MGFTLHVGHASEVAGLRALGFKFGVWGFMISGCLGSRVKQKTLALNPNP